jgi:hypothetical protein
MTDFNMNSNSQIANRINETLGTKGLKPFQPVAYFDSHMDCVRIELRDCSFAEERVNQHITLLEDNHPAPQRTKVAGLMIKGIRHLFKQRGWPLEGIVHVTTILDELVKLYPEFAEQKICQIVTEIDLSVDMSERDEIAA